MQELFQFTASGLFLEASGAGDVAMRLLLADARTNRGDRETLRVEERVIALIHEVHASLFRYLVCLGVTAHDADEITQEVYIKLYEHMEKGGPDENLQGWVFRVAHNLAITEYRRKKFLVGADPGELIRLYEANTVPAPSPEEVLLEKERTSRLLHAISELTDLQSQCLHLRAEGLRYREIAEILGVTISTVAESLRRVVSKLSRNLNNETR